VDGYKTPLSQINTVICIKNYCAGRIIAFLLVPVKNLPGGISFNSGTSKGTASCVSSITFEGYL